MFDFDHSRCNRYMSHQRQTSWLSLWASLSSLRAVVASLLFPHLRTWLLRAVRLAASPVVLWRSCHGYFRYGFLETDERDYSKADCRRNGKLQAHRGLTHSPASRRHGEISRLSCPTLCNHTHLHFARLAIPNSHRDQRPLRKTSIVQVGLVQVLSGVDLHKKMYRKCELRADRRGNTHKRVDSLFCEPAPSSRPTSFVHSLCGWLFSRASNRLNQRSDQSLTRSEKCLPGSGYTLSTCASWGIVPLAIYGGANGVFNSGNYTAQMAV